MFNKFGYLYFISFTYLCSCASQSSPKIAPIAKAMQDTSHIEGVKELSENIMVIYQDKKDNYWFGSWTDGLYKYDGSTITNYTKSNGLSSNRIEEIKEDQNGNLYINTTGGIHKYDGKTFTILETTNSNNWKLQANDLWFRCTDNDGQAYRYDGKYLHHLYLPKTKIGEAYKAKNPSNPLNPYAIYSLYKDSKSNIWFGGSILGLCRFDGKNFDWITEVDVTEIHDGPSNGVRSMVEDKDGYFWFNTMYRYDIYGDNVIQNPFQYKREKSIGSLDGLFNGNLNEYLSIIKSNNNDLWISTYLNGVWRYDGKNIKNYEVKSNGKNITVYALYKDNRGDIWLGSHENGVYKFNGKEFVRFMK